jgi:Transglutaminase elicitor
MAQKLLSTLSMPLMQARSRMVMLLAFGTCGSAVATLGGCASEASAEQTSDDLMDAIARREDPELLLGRPYRRLSDNISASDVGRTFGVEDAHVPYPDSYWPEAKNGIDLRWNAVESPLEKYMMLADPSHLRLAKNWNAVNAGSFKSGNQSWNGICNGWTAAALSEAPLKHAVYARMESGRITKCSAQSAGNGGCVKFEIGDINGLMATVYSDAPAVLIGATCGTPSGSIVRDADGRIDRNANGPGCKGLNPGSLLIVLSQRLKRDKLPLGIDQQSAQTTAEIWNQPAFRYTVKQFEPISMSAAANLVVSGQRTGNAASYKWNVAAKGFAYVDLTVHWVAETETPNVTFVSGLRTARQTRMTAVIELDRDAGAPGAQILGGELVANASSPDRLTNHPFVRLITGPAPELPNPKAAQPHNPFVKASLVRQLSDLARE